MQTVCNTYWDVGKGNLTAQNTRKPFGPHWGSLQRSRKLPSWWGGAGCPLPKNPIPPLSALPASPLVPHSKISSNAVAHCRLLFAMSNTTLQNIKQFTMQTIKISERIVCVVIWIISNSIEYGEAPREVWWMWSSLMMSPNVDKYVSSSAMHSASDTATGLQPLYPLCVATVVISPDLRWKRGTVRWKALLVSRRRWVTAAVSVFLGPRRLVGVMEVPTKSGRR